MPLAPTLEQIVAEHSVLGEAGGHVAGVASLDRGELRARGAHGLERRRADSFERRRDLPEVPARDGRADDDDQRGPVLALVVAVGVAVELARAWRGPRAERFCSSPLSRGGRVVRVEEIARVLRDLVVPACVDVASQLLEVALTEERPARGARKARASWVRPRRPRSSAARAGRAPGRARRRVTERGAITPFQDDQHGLRPRCALRPAGAPGRSAGAPEGARRSACGARAARRRTRARGSLRGPSPGNPRRRPGGE